MAVTSPCSKTRLQATVAKLVMKGKPLHALKFFLHIACKAKEKRLCASCS